MAKQICNHSEVDHIRRFLAYAKQQINDTQYYPPLNQYRSLVALALYSKCLTVAEAILTLLDADFGDEAFGLTRTMIDIYFTMQYIANKDSESRAKLYYEFHVKDLQDLTDVLKVFWPQLLPGLRPVSQPVLLKNYPRPHSWSGKPISQMALEPFTTEIDPLTGKPFVNDLAYRVFYRWTSHYVHPTIGALRNHIVKPGRDAFVVRSGRGKNMSYLAAFNVATYLGKTIIAFFRCMEDPQPEHLSTWAAALIAHLNRRHK